jgi:hypothetical protein
VEQGAGGGVEIRDQMSGNREQKTAIWRGGGRGAGLVKARAFELSRWRGGRCCIGGPPAFWAM